MASSSAWSAIDSASLWYTRNCASIVTHWPLWNSEVGSPTLPAGPDPLMPKRLWYSAASWLFPQADSSIACAIVTAAGTPHRCWAAPAPGAMRLMNAC